MIIGGSTLFKVNIKALLGKQYEQNKEERQSGFTLLYTAINFGGFAAALGCGIVAQTYGWHAGFGLAALGMLLGMSVFCLFERRLIQTEKSENRVNLSFFLPATFSVCALLGLSLYNSAVTSVVIVPLAVVAAGLLLRHLIKTLPSKQFATAIALLGLIIFYFTFEELMGSMLMVYVERQVDRTLFGHQIPTAALQMMNPLTIILSGPLLNGLFKHFPIAAHVRLGIAFLCLALSFTWLGFGSAQAIDILLSFFMMALGELFIAPTVYAYFSQIAPEGKMSVMMATVTTAFALASLLSGNLSALMTNFEIAQTTFFKSVALASVCVTIAVALVGKLSDGKQEEMLSGEHSGII